MPPAKPNVHMDAAARHGTAEDHKDAAKVAQKRKSDIDMMRKQKKLTVSEMVGCNYVLSTISSFALSLLNCRTLLPW